MVVWLMYDCVSFAWPNDLQPRAWTLRLEDSSSLINIASDYLPSSGLYVFQFDSTQKQSRMSLVSSQTDVTSVTKFFSLNFDGDQGPDSLNGAKVSAFHSAPTDFVTAATWHSTNTVTFFNFAYNT